MLARQKDIRCDTVPDPQIEEPRDAIVKSHELRDLRLRPAPLRRLHARHGDGDIMGHEFMGEVVEVGARQQAS